MQVINVLTIGNAGTLVGAVSFANHADRQFYLNEYTEKHELVDAIINLNYTGKLFTWVEVQRMHVIQYKDCVL